MSRSGIVMGLLFLGFIGCVTKAPKDTEVETTVEETPQMARLDSLTKLLDKSPNSANLLNERAKVFLEVNEVNFALADVGRALLIDSTKATYYLTISDVYFRLNKSEQCKKALEKAHAIQPDYAEPLYRLAQFE
ncbi:MAG: hypothetical protein K9G46_06430, partial [Flavobacteriales bacterium]|nr:hypothetical protein [Flavobacteriales bacterium]